MRCESRFYGIAVDEIDSPPEEIFEEEFEVHVCVKGAPSFLELDEDIDIALFTLCSKPSGFSNSALSHLTVLMLRAFGPSHSRASFPPGQTTRRPRSAGRPGS